MAEKCYFGRVTPTVERRGGLVFIQPEWTDCEVAYTPHEARVFMVRLRLALDEFTRTNNVERLRG